MTKSAALDTAQWQNPSADYRPAPFWIWNEAQEPGELVRQIREMHARGFGGFFMHARIGLKTPYLGSDWFAHVKACVAEAKSLGMQAWIYDEDRWPSGFAGGEIGRVPGLDYAASALFCQERDGQRVFEVVRGPRHAWLNDCSDPDLLNPDVTDAFVRLTHERYADAVGAEFAGTVPGVFMDEPSYVMWGHPDKFACVPWTGRMEAEFASRRGYALKPHLACLFFNEGDFRKVRIDFFRTVTELFAEAFARRIGDWCARHNLLSTGHMMMEDSLLSQVQAIGAAMPHYEHFQVPGIDHLGTGVPEVPLLQKQCASVARQLGRQRVLSELFGGCGWNAPLAELKPAGDFDYALGVNLLNQHLAYYSLRGRRKRDYPLSCSYHLPGYDLYKPFNDYFARLSYALSQGEAVRRILVLHPISTAWARYTPRDPAPVRELDRTFGDLCRALFAIQRDFDFGDEMLLERHARVDGGEFVVGQARYDVVIVPEADSWSENTFRLLREFASQGGRILCVGEPARFVGGVESPDLTAFLRSPQVRSVATAEAAALESALADVTRDIEVTDARGERNPYLVYQQRVCGDRTLFFLTFGRQPRETRVKVSLAGTGRVELWDAETGAVRPLPARLRKGRTEFILRVPAHGSRLIVLDRGLQPAGAATGFQAAAEPQPVSVATAALTVRPDRLPLGGPWSVSRLQPNCLLIEHGRVRFGESPWSQPMGLSGGGGIVELPNVHDLLDMSYERKYIWPDWPASLRLEFRSRLDPATAKDLRLVIEDPQAMQEFRVNGTATPVSTTDWWLDRQFRTVSLVESLRPGLNQIDCGLRWVSPILPNTLRFRPDGTEIENVYLVGDFGVRVSGTKLTLVPAKPLPGDPRADLTRHGLPFYVGTVRYEYDLDLSAEQTARQATLAFHRPGGEGLRLTVNGQTVRDLWCEPFAADCRGLFQAGRNRIQVDLFTTLGNLLGYLHHKSPWVDPAHAYDRFFFKPVGLGGVPVLVLE